MTGDDSQHNLPDWLKQARSRAQQQPQPDWLTAAQPAPPSPPPPRGLTIAAFELRGQPSPGLNQHLGTHRMMADNLLLTSAYEALQEAERQITAWVERTSSLPRTVDIYNLYDLAERLRHKPVQLATLLADAILLATGEIDTCPKDVRHRAILGLAQYIIDQQKKHMLAEAAAVKTVETLLAAIDRHGTPPPDRARLIRLHAHRVFLAAVIDTGSGTPPPRSALDGVWE